MQPTMKMKAFVLAAALASAVACGGGDDDAGDADATGSSTPTGGVQHTVQAKDNLQFDPKDITIKAGETVEWVNTGEVPHTVTFKSGGTLDEAIDGGDKTSFTFASAGKVSYVCKLHPAMTGTVTVQ